MCHIHLLVCLIWTLLVSSHVPAPPCPPSPPLAPIHTPFISCSAASASFPSPSCRSDIRALVCLDCSQLVHGQDGWEKGPPPLPVHMQIVLVLIKRQLYISLKSPVEVGEEKAYPSREAMVVQLEWMLWELLFRAAACWGEQIAKTKGLPRDCFGV